MRPILSRVVLTEMVNMIKPDERAVMTYVSCYYHAFQGAQQVWHSLAFDGMPSTATNLSLPSDALNYNKELCHLNH